MRLVPPIYVKPFVKRQKNDAADAEAICEAAQRPTMRFVAVKGEEQQARAMLFHTRDLLVRQRTQTINALRGHLAEFGVVAPQGVAHVGRLALALQGTRYPGSDPRIDRLRFRHSLHMAQRSKRAVVPRHREPARDRYPPRRGNTDGLVPRQARGALGLWRDRRAHRRAPGPSGRRPTHDLRLGPSHPGGAGTPELLRDRHQ